MACSYLNVVYSTRVGYNPLFLKRISVLYSFYCWVSQVFDFAANTLYTRLIFEGKPETLYTRAVWIEFCFCLACRVKGVESGVTISSHIFSQAQFLIELPTCDIAAN